MMMRNEKMIIYSYLSRSRELVFKREENDIIIKILIEYITENHDIEHVRII